MAHTNAYAPSPSELVQALGAPDRDSCPLTPALVEQWASVVAELERISDEDDWIMRYAPWLGTVHPHSHEESTGWTLGIEAWALDWFGDRVKALRKAAGQPVVLVACAELGGAR
jgi:hypothetical protein